MADISDCSILIVDDAEANIDILVEALGESYDLRVAMDGESALKAVETHVPDLILLDIMMQIGRASGRERVLRLV